MGVEQEIDFDAKVKEMMDWWRSHPSLPRKIEELTLRRFIYSTHGNLEYAKVLELNYDLRNKNPQIFLERDPSSLETTKINQVCDIFPLPNLTPADNYRVIFYRLRDTADSKFDFVESVKLFFMITDARIGSEPQLPQGDVPIFDMNGFSFKHIAKVLRNLTTLRLYMKFSQEALPVRLRQIHLINVSPLVDKIMSFMRPLMRKEVQNALKFHLPASETLFEFIPKDMVPQEYGGNGPSLDEYKEKIDKLLITKRDYLMNKDYWRMNLPRQEVEINGNSLDLKNLSID